MGARALVSLRGGSDDADHETAGRLVELLNEFFVRETLHPHLRFMLDVVYTEPSAVVPMNPQVVSALLESAGHTNLGADGIVQASGAFNSRVIERHFPTHGSPGDSLGLRMMYAAAVCAAYDYEHVGTGALRTDRSWREIALTMPALDLAVRRALRPDDDNRLDIDREDLGNAVLGFCQHLKVNEEWTDVFRQWTQEDALFCVPHPPDTDGY